MMSKLGMVLGLMVMMKMEIVRAAEGGLFGVAKKFGEELKVIENEKSVWVLLGIFVNYLLSVLGMISFLMILYGGFVILTAQGSEDKVAEGRKIIVYTVLGVVIIGLAYALNAWIFGSGIFA